MELDGERSPKISILLLNWNGRSLLGDLLDKAIESTLNQTYRNLEIIFIDNGSTDDSIEHVQQSYGNRLKIVELPENVGFCKANNLGVKFSSSDSKYVMFMNSDAILSRDYIERLISLMESDDRIGAIQGLEISPNGPPIIGGLIESLLSRPFTINIRPQFPLKVLWVAFTACIVDKKLFLTLEGFSTDLFMYHDDVDFCIRLSAYGRKCIGFPNVIYFHKRGGVIKSMVWLRSYLGYRNRLLISIRYLPKRYLIRGLLGAILELFYVMLKSFNNLNQRLEVLLYIKAIVYVMRNLKKQLKYRLTYGRHVKDHISYFIVKVPFKLSQVHEQLHSHLTKFKLKPSL